MEALQQKMNAYTRVDVETASQGKLIVMLFNGAIKRAEEAKRQMERGDRQSVHNNLIRAQEIMAELRGALNMKAGDVASNLDRIYEYFQHLLITGNVRKDPQPVSDAIDMMSEMRDTWAELFDRLAREDQSRKAPSINQHGATMLNMKG